MVFSNYRIILTKTYIDRCIGPVKKKLMPYVGTSRAARRESALLLSIFIFYYVMTNKWLLLILVILNRTI